MNNMKKIIVLLLAALLIVTAFVSCSDDVKVSENTWTEILESDRAFKVGDKYFDTLADAVAAVPEALLTSNSPKGYAYSATITVQKDVVGRGAELNKNSMILDLNGHTLTFTDVEDAALVVTANNVTVKNGTIKLFDSTEGLAIAEPTKEGAAVYFANMKASVEEGQYVAVALVDGSGIEFIDNSVITGDISVDGTSSFARIGSDAEGDITSFTGSAYVGGSSFIQAYSEGTMCFENLVFVEEASMYVSKSVSVKAIDFERSTRTEDQAIIFLGLDASIEAASDEVKQAIDSKQIQVYISTLKRQVLEITMKHLQKQ